MIDEPPLLVPFAQVNPIEVAVVNEATFAKLIGASGIEIITPPNPA
jgi:hypothetical protein